MRYRILFGSDKDGIFSSVVNNQTFEMWNVSVEELHTAAVENDSKIRPIILNNMEDIVMEMMGMTDEPARNLLNENIKASDIDMPMFVLSNESKQYGAGAVLHQDVMEKVSEVCEGNFFVLPSSLHEVLILPDDGQKRVAELEQMVKEVNQSEVKDEDLLSYKVQYYDATNKVLVNARQYEMAKNNPVFGAELKNEEVKQEPENTKAQKEPKKENKITM